MRYFTSDLHLGSALINKYAHRPFKDAKEALDCLTDNICKTCDCYDSLIHVGDFMLAGADRHGAEEDHGFDMNVKDYLSDINPRVTLLSGNHDDGHNCEADCKSMVLDLNQNWRNVYVNHFPSYHPDYHGLVGYGKKIQINLCGHVHDLWLLNYDNSARVLNINVGIDVWHYKPVRDAQITELLDYVFKHRAFKFSWQQTRKEFDGWKNNNDLLMAVFREQRKAEKHAKKGLTPEECERRRIEAMKKKGLMK